MKIEDKIEYWLHLSEMDIPVMEHLFESKDFAYSLYIGQLVLEKILKAHYVKVNNENPPRIHDLLKLAKYSKIILDEKQMKFLISVTSFNIEARYPDEKMSFYKIVIWILQLIIFQKLRRCICG